MLNAIDFLEEERVGVLWEVVCVSVIVRRVRADSVERLRAMVRRSSLLMQTALEFDVLGAELEAQMELLKQELFVTYVNEAFTGLTEQHNVTKTLSDIVAGITERVYEELEMLQALDEPKSVAGLPQELDWSVAGV